jgi:hypothetical protein
MAVVRRYAYMPCGQYFSISVRSGFASACQHFSTPPIGGLSAIQHAAFGGLSAIQLVGFWYR